MKRSRCWRSPIRRGGLSRPPRSPIRCAGWRRRGRRRSMDRRSWSPAERFSGMSEKATMRGDLRPFKDFHAAHFSFAASEDGRVAIVRLNRPERKNPLTLESYAELRDLFHGLAHASDIRAVVLTGEGGN